MVFVLYYIYMYVNLDSRVPSCMEYGGQRFVEIAPGVGQCSVAHGMFPRAKMCPCRVDEPRKA